MIRPVTCVCFLLACGSGLYLYQAKHRVNVLDQQIERTVHATGAIREQIRLLHADWTLLNQPDRLQKLADQFLTLKTTNPAQFISMADLDARVPMMPEPEAPTTDEGSAAAVVAALPAEPVPAQPTALVRAKAVETLAPVHREPVEHARVEDPRPVSRPPAPVMVAAPAPRQAPTLLRREPQVIEAAARPAWVPRPVSTVRSYVPAPAAPAISGSLLGMAHAAPGAPAAPPPPAPLPGGWANGN
ncbi:MAG TPA: hypothetical protein VLI93_17145 [Acetobacteraceae bacterium]|nr:hypothetical protein [Acetobacteraceae bacterium]